MKSIVRREKVNHFGQSCQQIRFLHLWFWWKVNTPSESMPQSESGLEGELLLALTTCKVTEQSDFVKQIRLNRLHKTPNAKSNTKRELKQLKWKVPSHRSQGRLVISIRTSIIQINWAVHTNRQVTVRISGKLRESAPLWTTGALYECAPWMWSVILSMRSE